MRGFSIIGIKRELEKRGIKTPTGKEKWSKRTVDVMLSNEKYVGVVRLLNGGEHQEHYVSENNHPEIISKEQFEAVQIEKKNRSNVLKTEDGNRRKNKKYSSKNRWINLFRRKLWKIIKRIITKIILMDQ